MYFKELVIENYKSYEGKHTFSFGEPNSTKNIVLIGGNNGSGKTSFLECINICLYGIKDKELVEKINKKIQEKTPNNYIVFFGISFITDENEEIEINRVFRKVNNLKEEVRIFNNGRLLEGLDQDGMKEYIENTIPKDISGFFFFDGEKVKHFANNLSPNNIKDSIEKVLGLKKLKTLWADLDYIYKDSYNKNSSGNTNNIEQLDLDLKGLELNRKNIDDKIRQLREENDEIFIEIVKKKDYLVKVFGGVQNENNIDIAKLSKQQGELENQKNSIDEKIKSYIDSTFPFLLLSNHYGNLKEAIKLSKDFRKRKTLKEESKDMIDKIIHNLYIPSDIYGNEWNDEKYQTLYDKIYNAIGSNENLHEPTINLGEAEENQLNMQINNFEKEKQLDLLSLVDKREEIQKIINELKTQIEGYKPMNNKSEFERITNEKSNLDMQFGQKKEEIKNLENKIDGADNQINLLSKKINEARIEEEKFQKNAKQLENIRKYRNYIEKYIEKITTNKLDELCENTLYMFKQLSYKNEITNIEIDPFSYKINLFYKDYINDNAEFIVNKEELSEGEKEVFALSLIWGLAKTSHINIPVIIDTPLARLSSDHRYNIVNNFFPTASGQVIILSQDEEIRPNEDYYFALKESIYKEITIKFNIIERNTEITHNIYNP